MAQRQIQGKQMGEGSLALSHAAAPAESFDAVFRLHQAYVYRLAYSLLGQAEDAEDVTQEVFLRVHKGLSGYRADRASLRTWLTQIVVNACQTHRRRNWRRRHTVTVGEDAADALLALVDASPGTSPEGQTLQAELRRTLQEVLARLKQEHRTALVLHYYLDLSCPEIADLLGCAEGTVYSRLHYARRRLQSELEQRAARLAEQVRP